MSPDYVSGHGVSDYMRQCSDALRNLDVGRIGHASSDGYLISDKTCAYSSMGSIESMAGVLTFGAILSSIYWGPRMWRSMFGGEDGPSKKSMEYLKERKEWDDKHSRRDERKDRKFWRF